MEVIVEIYNKLTTYRLIHFILNWIETNGYNDRMHFRGLEDYICNIMREISLMNGRA